MPRDRDEPSARVGDLLRQARRELGLSLAFITRMDGTTQYLEVVEPRLPALLLDGRFSFAQETSICQAVLSGRLPPVIPDLRAFPAAAGLPAAKAHIRAFLSVPIRLSDGTFYGTLCAAGFRPMPRLGEAEERLMRDLADATAEIIEPRARQLLADESVRGRIDAATAGAGRLLFDPVVHLASRRRIGACVAVVETDRCEPVEDLLAGARRLGEQRRLELHLLEKVAEALPRTSGYLAVPVGAATLLHRPYIRALAALPLGRIVLECSAADPVDDPPALAAALEPLRAAGLRLAVCGAELRHLHPELVKLAAPDEAEAAGRFAAGPVRPRLVAAGIATERDAAALPGLGVQRGQGPLFGPPVPPEHLRDAYPPATVAPDLVPK